MAGEQSPHERGDRFIPGLKQKVNMIAHQCPGKACRACLCQEHGYAPYEVQPVFLIPKNLAALDAADDYMVERLGRIDAGLAWHGSPYITSAVRLSF